MFSLPTAADFIDISVSLTFTENSEQELCQNVAIVDDAILEDSETYTIMLSSLDGNAIVQTSTTLLVILDETDGNLTWLY